MSYFIYHDGEMEPRNAKQNYWEPGTEPDIEKFYPSNSDIWAFEPWCTEPNPIGGTGSGEGDGLEAGIILEGNGEYSRAVETYREFAEVDSHSVVRRTIALRRMLSASVAGNLNLPSLLAYYNSLSLTARARIIADNAARLATETKAAMRNYAAAIQDYEGIAMSHPTFEDSVYAVIDAGRAYLLWRQGGSTRRNQFTPRIASLEPRDWEEYISRRDSLLCDLHNRRLGRVAGNGPEGEIIALPQEFALHQNRPNPFNPVTQIRYDLPQLSEVKMEVFNILGRKVCTLVNGLEPAGYRSAVWNGRDRSGLPVSSGIYIYRLTAEGQRTGEKFAKSGKMLLLE